MKQKRKKRKEDKAHKQSPILTPDFFNRDTLTVAEDLLGKFLIRQLGEDKLVFPITEVEAYDGPNDKACHAHKGRTKRTEVMFGPPGYLYVYQCYGIHWMLNMVTGPVDYPAAVLIRAVGPHLGPGKLTKALNIDKNLNEKPIIPETGVWVEDRGIPIPKDKIQKTPRIGVDYAGEEWAGKNYRMIIGN